MVLDDLFDLTLQLLRDSSLRDLLKKTSLRRRKVLAELSFPLDDLVNRDGIEETVYASVDDRDLNFNRQRLVLTLLYTSW